MKISGEKIKVLSYWILGIGLFLGFFSGLLGGSFKLGMRYYDAGKDFNVILMFVVWIFTFITGLFVYIGGGIMELLERINDGIWAINRQKENK